MWRCHRNASAPIGFFKRQPAPHKARTRGFHLGQSLQPEAESSKQTAANNPASQPSDSDDNFALRSLAGIAGEGERRYEASEEQLLHFYEQMLLIRRFEEKAGQLYGLGLIGGFCHLYIGQEAVAIGLQSRARQ